MGHFESEKNISVTLVVEIGETELIYRSIGAIITRGLYWREVSTYRRHAIITCFLFETALDNKPRILGPHFLV